MSPKKRSRSVGTRAKPTCWECGQTGHYSSSCPTLTEKLLKTARQTSSSAQIRQFLAKNSKASLLNLPMKRWRTLKRASGRRHFRAGPAGKNAQSKARKCRQTAAHARHAEKDKLRAPRPKANPAKQMRVTKKTVEAAHKKLLQTKWCWMQKNCDCGGVLLACSFKHCQQRGLGRKFVYCTDCRNYKDVMHWSHLPNVRMSLPSLAETIRLYFESVTAPTAEDIARRIGTSGTSGGPVHSITDALWRHEVRCWEARQKKSYAAWCCES